MEIAVAVPRGYSRVNVTGMIDRGQKLKLQEKSLQYPMKPEEFPGPSINPPKISSPYSQGHITGRHYENNIQTTANKQNYMTGIRVVLQQSTDCFEY